MTDEWRRELYRTPTWDRLRERIGREAVSEVLDHAVPAAVLEAGERRRPYEEALAAALRSAFEEVGLGELDRDLAAVMASEAAGGFRILVGEKLMEARDEPEPET